MPRLIPPLLAAVIAAVLARPSAADPPNYQRYVIGERSLGMAGAYAAAVDDSMAIYYNPGALVFADTTAVSASKSIYAADHRTIRDGFVPNFSAPHDAIDLDGSNDLSWPSTLTFMTTFGKKKNRLGHKIRHSFGFAMLVPTQEDYSFRGKHHPAQGVADNQTYYLFESYRTVWTGLAYAFRPHRSWGLGLSGFWSNDSYQRRYDGNYFNPPEDTSACDPIGCGELEFVESILRIKTNSLVFGAGVLFTPNDRVRLGLSFNAPGILMRGLSGGTLDQTMGMSSTSDPAAGTSRLYTDDYDLKVAAYDPASIRLGASYTLPLSFTVDLDLGFHFPGSYDRIIGDAVASRLEESPEASPSWFDPGIVRHIERRPVLNANLGTEVLLPKGWTVRTGLFSDFSSAPEVVAGDTPQLTRANRLGGAFSIGHRSKDHDITLGVIGTYGAGKASVFQPELSRGRDDSMFEPERYTERALFVFIAGVQKAVEKKAEELWKKLVD